MIRIAQAIVVEGRYDRNAICQVVDAPVFQTDGFHILHDREQLALLRKTAEKRGLIVFTDSDGAGLVIRNFLKSTIPGAYLIHAYAPEIPGKEKRKKTAGKAGILGVEGMTPETIIRCLERAGATILDKNTPHISGGITKQDLYDLGLSGKAGSREKRLELIKKLDFPSTMSANALLEALNVLYTREQLEQILE